MTRRYLLLCAAVGVGAATVAAFQQRPAPRAAARPARLHRRAKDTRQDDDLPDVAPGEIDWDDEFKKLNRGETAVSGKINEIGLDVERAGRLARQSARKTTDSVGRAARDAKRAAPRLGGDATFWFAVIAAISVFPLIVGLFAGPPDVGGGGNVFV